MSNVKLIIDGAKMQELIGVNGPLARHLIRKTTAFQLRARAQAPRKTGCLQDSIVKRAIYDKAGTLTILVVADTTPCSPTRTAYAMFVHEGTKAHVIQGNPTLAFHWDEGPNGPGVYFFASVNHPGTKANKFFTDNISAFAAV